MTTRAAVFGAFSAMVFASALGIAAPIANADSAYRYWAYWTASPSAGDATWQYAIEGSGTRVPADGDVEGWRFGLGGEAEPLAPGTAPDFDAICGSTPPPADGKRVGVVVDSGILEHAPDGEQPGAVVTACVVADPAATGFQVLAEVTDIRTDAGFVCGLGGYPKTECAPLVSTPAGDDDAESGAVTSSVASSSASQESVEPTASDAGDDSNIAAPLIAAATVSVLALVGFGIWRSSKRRQRT